MASLLQMVPLQNTFCFPRKEAVLNVNIMCHQAILHWLELKEHLKTRQFNRITYLLCTGPQVCLPWSWRCEQARKIAEQMLRWCKAVPEQMEGIISENSAGGQKINMSYLWINTQTGLADVSSLLWLCLFAPHSEPFGPYLPHKGTVRKCMQREDKQQETDLFKALPLYSMYPGKGLGLCDASSFSRTVCPSLHYIPQQEKGFQEYNLSHQWNLLAVAKVWTLRAYKTLVTGRMTAFFI